MNFSTEAPKVVEEAATIEDVATETTLSIDDLGYYPTDLVLKGINTLQETAGLEWYQSIIIATIVARFTLFPLAVKAMRGTSRLAYASRNETDSGSVQEQSDFTTGNGGQASSCVQKYGISSPLASLLVLWHKCRSLSLSSWA